MTEKNQKIHQRLQELLPGYSAAAKVIPKAAKGAAYSAAVGAGLLMGAMAIEPPTTEAALIGPGGSTPVATLIGVTSQPVYYDFDVSSGTGDDIRVSYHRGAGQEFGVKALNSAFYVGGFYLTVGGPPISGNSFSAQSSFFNISQNYTFLLFAIKF